MRKIIKLQTKKLSKSFFDKNILKEINLSVPDGRNLLVIGGSGVGKSVLLKCILGIIKPDTGAVYFNNKPLVGKNRNEFLDRFGMLFQGGALFDSLPVWENISFRYKYNGKLSAKDRKKLATEKLNLVGLSENVAEIFPSELSGGMQKRVGIARAIITNPDVIFFDEPTSGLDPIMANTINNLIRSIVSELGATAITISHDLNSIRKIADDVLMLHNGSVVWEGSLKNFEVTTNTYVKQFINAN